MERYTDPTRSLQQSLPSLLSPLTQINYILGTFPYSIKSNNNGNIKLSSKSVHYFRAIITFGLMSITTGAIMYRAIVMFKSPRPLNSNGEPIPITAKMVELVCALYANMISLIILGLTFFNKTRLERFFNGMQIYASSVKSYIDPYSVGKTVKRLFVLYGILALVSATVVSIRFYHRPEMGPFSVIAELLGMEKQIGRQLISIISATFIFYIALAKYACLGYVEIVSCALAKCMRRCMENIMEDLESQIQTWKRHLNGVKSQVRDKDDFMNLLASTTVEKSPPVETNPKFKFQNEFENYIEQIREFNPGLISPPSSVSTSPSVVNPKISGLGNMHLLKTSPGKVLSHAARSFSSVAAMQSVTNSVFGITLAINIGCIVGMSVILKYLVIKHLVTDFKVIPGNMEFENGTATSGSSELFTEFRGNDTSFAGNIFPNTSDPITLSSSAISSPYGIDELEWLMFLGLDVSMFIRLGVVVILLGKVHETALKFNAMMSQSFLTANQLIDELAEALQNVGNGNDADEVTKSLMTPTQTSSIIAFMSLYSTNPVAFTAGGLFVFSSGLLLMIISVILSYLVFLLQA